MKFTRIEKKPGTLRFVVISDVHIWNNIYKNALIDAVDQFAEIGELDGLLLDGDIVMMEDANCHPEIYDYVKEIIDSKLAGIPTVYAIGNHEFPMCDKTPESVELCKKTFVEKTGQPIKYDTVIGGYHFIADISVEAPDLAHIESVLEKSNAEDENKPVFLMLHDFYVSKLSHSHPAALQWQRELEAILQKYPQTIVLVGHLHMTNQYPHIAVQNGFTVVQVPALGETGFIFGDGLFNSYITRIPPQAMLLEIADGVVCIRKLSFADGKCIGDPIVIDAKQVRQGVENYSLKARKMSNIPYFADNAEITATSVSASEVEISFPRAENKRVNEYIDDGFVIAYNVEAFDGDNCVFSENVISNFYSVLDFSDISERFSGKITGLAPSHTYTVSVTPISPFRKTGTPIKTTVITTAE